MRFQCCFCTLQIESTTVDPVRLTISAATDSGEQELFAHQKCLRKAVHPSVPLLVDDDG